jgi:hypothetical protein
MSGKSYPAGRLDLLSLIVEPPSYDRLGAIFVCSGRLRWESIDLIIEILVVGPVLLLLATEGLETARKENVAEGEGHTLRP